MLARQAPYLLSPFFALVIFQIGSHVSAQGLSWSTILLTMPTPVAGITGGATMPGLGEMGSC
jgi:hypothetical protein